MANDNDINRAWAMFLYASEDYQKALRALESAEKALSMRRKELHAIMNLQQQTSKPTLNSVDSSVAMLLPCAANGTKDNGSEDHHADDRQW